jgi:hypothetical protein
MAAEETRFCISKQRLDPEHPEIGVLDKLLGAVLDNYLR